MRERLIVAAEVQQENGIHRHRAAGHHRASAAESRVAGDAAVAGPTTSGPGTEMMVACWKDKASGSDNGAADNIASHRNTAQNNLPARSSSAGRSPK